MKTIETEGSTENSTQEANIPEESESPPQNLPKQAYESKSASKSKTFGKLNLEVHDVKVDDVPQMPEIQEGEEKGEALSDFTEDDGKLLAQSIWNIPPAILGDHLAPDPKLVDRFGVQLARYCELKGINMWDYAFQELPLLMSGMMIGGAMVKAQIEHKKEEDARKEEEEKKEGKEG